MAQPLGPTVHCRVLRTRRRLEVAVLDVLQATDKGGAKGTSKERVLSEGFLPSVSSGNSGVVFRPPFLSNNHANALDQVGVKRGCESKASMRAASCLRQAEVSRKRVRPRGGQRPSSKVRVAKQFDPGVLTVVDDLDVHKHTPFSISLESRFASCVARHPQSLHLLLLVARVANKEMRA